LSGIIEWLFVYAGRICHGSHTRCGNIPIWRTTRKKLFHIYRDLLINQNVPWVEVGGEGEHRLKNAIEAGAENDARAMRQALLAACTYCTNF